MTKISDKELLEELSRRFNENKRTIGELNRVTEELQNLNQKLKESEALKTHFISNISNEIINPFTSIIGLSKSILEVSKEDWKTVISMVALIHTEAFNLDFQLKNIFAAAKLEAGEVQPEFIKVNIIEILHEALDSFKQEARKKKIEIINRCDIVSSKTEPFYFITDPEKLRLIISNLLSNAIKFSFSNNSIIINSSINKNHELIICVQDFGEGISETNQKIIFDRFRRVDSGINSNIRGHGLGLSINKAIVDLLDGELKVETKLGEGSKFTVIIPESEVSKEGITHDGNEFMFDDGEVF